jgi:hypothetical protein
MSFTDFSPAQCWILGFSLAAILLSVWDRCQSIWHVPVPGKRKSRKTGSDE